MTPALATASPDDRFDDKFDRIVKYYRCGLPDTDPKKVRLSKDLQVQLGHWITIYGLLSTGRYPKTTHQINAILKALPGITPRTARNYLADTKRFFSVLDDPNLAYERVMQAEELKDDIRLSKKKGDMRAVAVLRKTLIDLLQLNKTEEAIENKTVINIINFNPEQLGGQLMPDAQLDKLVSQLLEQDKKEAAKFFDPYEDVSTPQKPA